MNNIPDVWWVTSQVYTTREFKTVSGCAKAVAKFTKGRDDVESVDFNNYDNGESGWVWAASIVTGG